MKSIATLIVLLPLLPGCSQPATGPRSERSLVRSISGPRSDRPLLVASLPNLANVGFDGGGELLHAFVQPRAKRHDLGGCGDLRHLRVAFVERHDGGFAGGTDAAAVEGKA